MSRVARLALVALAAAVGTAARAESPIVGSATVRLGEYRPAIDDTVAGSTPYAEVFKTKRPLFWRLEAAWTPWRRFGSLSLGLSTGWWTVDDRGLLASTRAPSGERTALNVIPSSAFVEYRFDWLAERFRWLPLAPYARATFERYNWWVTGSGGKTSATGATNGWSATAGVGLLLDALDPGLGREFDEDSGVNHTYFTVDVTRTTVNDFGAKGSWDLSDERTTVMGGILFVF